MAETSSHKVISGPYLHRRRMEIYFQLPQAIAALLKKIEGSKQRLLDVGCWDGEFTKMYGDTLQTKENHGLDFFEAILDIARARKIQAHKIDLETELFPYSNDTFDVVVCNQVLEHLKQVYLPVSEIHRVLKVGGYAVISVPNLAASHNRALMLFGRQPATIRIMGPHVRSFTMHAFTQFLCHNDLFRCKQIAPVGMYPFPERIGSAFSRLLPSLCHTPVWLLQKTGSQKSNWFEVMKGHKEQTTFFGDDRVVI
jgi:SAM-dependent methyltransferase